MNDSELEARLEKLERQNRWLKRAGLAALVLVGSALLTAFAPQRPAKSAAVPEILEAQHFRLKDAQGEIRAELYLDKDNPHLALFDAAGHVATKLYASPVGPGLTFHDAEGELRATLGVVSDQSSLDLFDAKGKLRTTLGVMADQSSLILFDAKGKARAQLVVIPEGTSLLVSDAARFMAIIGTAELEMTRTGESRRTSAASVVLFDKDGKVIWRIP